MKRLLLAALLPFAAHAQSATLFRNARVFDGTRIHTATDVLVDQGTIVRVGRKLPAPAGATIVDATGKTLMPGLIDAHTHTFTRGSLEQAVVFGVTTHLDQFSVLPVMKQMKSEQDSGRASARADFFSAGILITAPKGHGTQFGIPIPTLTNAADAQAFVDARIAEGSDWLKIVYDDGRTYGRSIPTLSRETLTAAIKAAHTRGKIAVVHIGDERSAIEALEAGADGLVHIFTDSAPSAAFVTMAVSRKAFIVPTLAVSQSLEGVAAGATLLNDASFDSLLDEDARTTLRRVFTMGNSHAKYAHAESAVRALVRAKVPLLAGSDAPNPGTTYGASMHQEMERLVRAGLTPVQAMAAATSIPAAKFRIPQRGRIAAGMRADLLLIDGDPTTDITRTRAIAGVWKGGVAIDREATRRRISTARAAAADARTKSVPSGLGDGHISDFESDTETPRSLFGAGWVVSTDAMAGGKSIASMAVVPSGAAGTAKALEVKGTLALGAAFGWSGVMFSPGARPMAPANLSSKREIVFSARGDGREYQLMLFSQRRGFMPLSRPFIAGAEWKEIVLPFSTFGDTDGADVMGLVFAATGTPGVFAFQIDEIRLR